VGVPGPGQVPAAFGAVGQDVALDDGDDVRELDEGTGREQTGEAAAEGDGGLNAGRERGVRSWGGHALR
jgi:hypothetical protein